MSTEKLQGLKEILMLDPRNGLARYGIAMELIKIGDTSAALGEFDTLLANDPKYIAAYFMSAQALVHAGRTKDAVKRLQAGIDCASQIGNGHAVSEMQAYLDNLNQQIDI